MGTSVSQGSPRTLNWSAVSAAYQDERFEIARVVKEIWRAAQSDPATNWAELLSSPALSVCLNAVLQSHSPAIAVKAAARAIAEEGLASLPAEIGKRAAIQSFLKDDRAAAFAAAVFSEATNYLVSRDLCESFGSTDRLKSISGTKSFKKGLLDRVNQVVREIQAPASAQSWADFSRRVALLLSR